MNITRSGLNLLMLLFHYLLYNIYKYKYTNEHNKNKHQALHAFLYVYMRAFVRFFPRWPTSGRSFVLFTTVLTYIIILCFVLSRV